MSYCLTKLAEVEYKGDRNIESASRPWARRVRVSQIGLLYS